MKKLSFVICFIILWASSLFAQKDTGFFKNIIIKVNPTLIAGGLIQVEGEYGGIIEFPIVTFHNVQNNDKRINLLVGGGYNREFVVNQSINNPRPDGTGYTIRAGINYYFKKKKFFSFQVFYRQWNINRIIDYGGIILDPVLEPFGIFGSGVGSEESPAPEYRDNAVVNIYAFDFFYGKQHSLFRCKNLTIEWYVGIGLRYKNAEYEETGKYIFPSSFNIQYYPFPYSAYYTPLSTPIYSNDTSLYPDLKLGFMVGFIL